MSVFFRVFTSFFLLTICQISQAKTYTYYKGYHPFVSNVCYSSTSEACSAFTDFIVNNNTSVASCGASGGSVSASFTTITRYSDGTQSSSTGSPSDFAQAHYVDCSDGYILAVNSACSATCVPDPCLPHKGSVVSALTSCGVANCPAGGHFVGD